MASKPRPSRPSHNSNTQNPRGSNTAVETDTPGPIDIDTLLCALQCFGVIPRSVKRRGRSSLSIAELRAWTDRDIQRDFAQAIAGLCVLHAPATKGQPRPKKKDKSNVVAASLLLEDNPKQFNLLCSGNQALDTPSSQYGGFFRDAVLKLKDIARAAIPLSDSNDLHLAEVRAQHEDLAQFEKKFVLWAYQSHLPKLKPRIHKRGRALEDRLQQDFLKGKLQEPIIIQLLNSLKEVNNVINLDPKDEDFDRKIQRIHMASLNISHAIWMKRDVCEKYQEDIDTVIGRTLVQILEKVTTAASYVNNLVILAACTQLGQALIAENSFKGPTFVKPPSSPGKFTPSAIGIIRLYDRLRHLSTVQKDAANSTNLQPIEAWKSSKLKRFRSPKSYSSTHVHCECIIAVKLLIEGRKGEHYIGCPKLSCAPCSLFIDAVNAVGMQQDKEDGLKIIMEGTHGNWYLPWSIPPDTPGPVQEEFEKLLLSSINRAVVKVKGEEPQSNSDGAVNIAPYDSP